MQKYFISSVSPRETDWPCSICSRTLWSSVFISYSECFLWTSVGIWETHYSPTLFLVTLNRKSCRKYKYLYRPFIERATYLSMSKYYCQPLLVAKWSVMKWMMSSSKDAYPNIPSKLHRAPSYPTKPLSTLLGLIQQLISELWLQSMDCTAVCGPIGNINAKGRSEVTMPVKPLRLLMGGRQNVTTLSTFK